MPSKAAPFPTAQSTSPYWRNDVKPIDAHRSTKCLPSRADIVIIGAGYAGASIAHHLIERYDEKALPSIVILEAREACSGASGRNGGHLKPDPFSRAASVLKTYGKDVAEHVASFEARQVKEVRDLVDLEGIDCDFEEVTVRDVCLYPAGRDKIEADLTALTEADISTAKELEYHSNMDAEDVSGVKGAKSCVTFNAARLWPYQLVSHVLEKAVSHGINLQTHTPVTSVKHAQGATVTSIWAVNTPRGSIECSTVIYATNAYTSALVPELKDKIVPVRGMVARLVPTDDAPRLTDSYMMRFSDYEYDYMITRPDGSIIVGGAKRDFYEDLNQWYDVSDDSRLMMGAERYFNGYMQRHFAGWEDCDVRTDQVWTGIMGYSNDGFPYVGPVCGKPGQYVCAGFTGHGMPQIFLSAKAIATMVTTGASAVEVDLPLPYHTSPARWSLQRVHASLQQWQAFSDGKATRARL
ncbi:hypothetical protein LTR62_001954 [Meristemomyces frigidus]|uniref:FAD dependent oxidoreductase domain-containing protein n=1 Tax=Meristemomyces frigidus TaxID=1508187 RepID=A0AAN7YFZ3_9PEZI|nr:hypothetical protein LTR62_001954 [Meristemomyces frigidus]